jgi:DNA-binding protein HU-beta
MSKKDLITAISSQCGLPTAKATEVVDCVFKHIESSMKAGTEVSIPGFGKFKSTRRPERKARNPQTGKEMMLPATNVPKFTASKTLKDSLNA